MTLHIKNEEGEIERFDDVSSVQIAEKFYDIHFLVIVRKKGKQLPIYKNIDLRDIVWLRVDE